MKHVFRSNRRKNQVAQKLAFRRNLGILLCFFLGIVHAKLSMQVETSEVQLDQPFKLILTMDNVATGQVPDITPLQKNFAVLGTERSMSYSIRNGQAQSTSQWIILLKPKRVGTLSIPALQMGQERTPASSIKVTSTAATARDLLPTDFNKDVMLVASTTVNEPYISQQVIYTVKVYNSQQLLDATYQPPQVVDALLVPLGEGRHYQIMKQGKAYMVNEQQYAIFPQKSGKLTITPPELSALIYDMPPRRVHLQAKPTVLQVRPKPTSFRANDWLAAKQVFLTESYDKQAGQFSQGSTLVRTVTLKAIGLPAQLLPALDFGSSNQFSIYPEKPKEKNVIKQTDLVGSITVKATYLLNQAGKRRIPPLQITWFNTTTGKEEIAALPPLDLQVEARDKKTKQTITTPNFIHTAQPTKKALPETVNNRGIASFSIKSSVIAWWIVGGFALIWLLALVWWYRQGRVAKHTSLPPLHRL